MAVRWYLAYALSYRNIEAEIGRKYKRTIGSSWRMDEAYIKVKGKWCYLYRAVDKSGTTIDFILSKNRDRVAAKRFFNKAIDYSGKPEKITIDKSGSNYAALKSINKKYADTDKIGIRQIKYLNNIIDQAHCFIKQVIKLMMGFKAFHSAYATLVSIELHHMLHKNQHRKADNIPVFE